MIDRFSRTYMLLNSDGMERLKNARILLFGLGGVGGHVAEALARSGVGSMTLVDADTVHISNINRQIIATEETIGIKKTEAMQKRIASINPDCKLTLYDMFYLPESENIISDDYNYIIDAIDTITAKIDIVLKAQALNIPVISCMGTGNKLRPELLEITDLYKTSVCPLCRVMRTELKKRGCQKLTVVYSPEKPLKPNPVFQEDERTPGSTAFVPPVAGLLIASHVVRALTGQL